ncbi:hypothetical protein M3Y98_00941800 [Aphelenchoides besseyi]|nr:hypothetical protein M3Y98_00941800 [Aphelenchoides besseyi]KAI6194344.1 hypothetical protein M3Y96_01115000 [Aphelenchoides besseyi]
MTREIIKDVADYAVPRCRICQNATANGNHYGVLSCARCKVFFRRMILQKTKPECVMSTKCAAEKLCRGCRLARCLELGMQKEALKAKRDIIGVRRTPGCTTTVNLTAEERKLLSFISGLTRKDREIRMRKLEAIRSKNEAIKLAEKLKNVQKQTNPLMSKTDVSIVTQMDMLMMLEWSTSIPEFSLLPIDDRLILLKRFAAHNLILESGYYTARHGRANLWMIANGAMMPRDMSLIPDEVKKCLPESRIWRQQHLWSSMVDRCIDEIVIPMRRSKLLDEELLVLKILTLFHCGNHNHTEETAHSISETTRQKLIAFKNQVIRALFVFYKSSHVPNYEERLGHLILMQSGVFSAASILLETYTIMNFFGLAAFDQISEQLLFNSDNLKTDFH